MEAESYLHVNTRSTNCQLQITQTTHLCHIHILAFIFPVTIRDKNLSPDDEVNGKNVSTLKESINKSRD